MVETQITQIAVTPYNNGSSTTGKTDLVYTLRLSPKKIADTEVRSYPSLYPKPPRPTQWRRGPGVHAAPVAQENRRHWGMHKAFTASVISLALDVLHMRAPVSQVNSICHTCWRLAAQGVADHELLTPLTGH